MKTEPLFTDYDSLQKIITQAQRSRIAHLSRGSSQAASAVRWSGIAALCAFGFALFFSGPGAQADAKTGHGGSQTSSTR
jgi:hypothetical protein